MEATDRLELHELPGRYGDAIDDRAWDRLDGIFTTDGVFDLTAVGGLRLEGLAAIKQFMDGYDHHPAAHLMTNIYVDETPTGAHLNFRIIALLDGDRVGTGAYSDDVVKTPDGWRVTNRVVSRRGRLPRT